jgi:hypothetical protein
LTSALVGGEWSASRPGHFTPGERAPGTHWKGGWVGPRTGLDKMERRKISPLPELELRPLRSPARIQSLLFTNDTNSAIKRTRNAKMVGLFNGDTVFSVRTTFKHCSVEFQDGKCVTAWPPASRQVVEAVRGKGQCHSSSG